MLPMRFQGVVEEVAHVDKQLGVGGCQPRVQFDNGGGALLEPLKGDVIMWYCCYKKKTWSQELQSSS